MKQLTENMTASSQLITVWPVCARTGVPLTRELHDTASGTHTDWQLNAYTRAHTHTHSDKALHWLAVTCQIDAECPRFKDHPLKLCYFKLLCSSNCAPSFMYNDQVCVTQKRPQLICIYHAHTNHTHNSCLGQRVCWGEKEEGRSWWRAGNGRGRRWRMRKKKCFPNSTDWICWRRQTAAFGLAPAVNMSTNDPQKHQVMRLGWRSVWVCITVRQDVAPAGWAASHLQQLTVSMLKYSCCFKVEIWRFHQTKF